MPSRRRWPVLRCGAIAVLLCAPDSASAGRYQPPASQPIGIVDQVTGSWRLVQQQMRFVARGELIYRGQTLFIDRSTSAAVSIVMFANGQKWEKRCSAATPCEGSYRPSPPREDHKSQPTFWAFFLSYWTPERQLEPLVLGSRSAGDGGPRHALLQRSSTGVDLGPALEKVKAAAYHVTLTPASTSISSAPRLETLQIGPNTSSVISQLPSGLYMLTLTTVAGETIGSGATVLVIEETDTQIRTAWDEARSVSAAWSASELTIEAMLVRTLYALDAQRKRF